MFAPTCFDPIGPSSGSVRWAFFFMYFLSISTPCFTMWYTAGYLQYLQLILYLCYSVAVAQQCLWTLVLFWLVLQHFWDGFEEPGDSDCVYVVFHYQGKGRFCSTVWRSLECSLHSNMRWRAVCSVSSGQVKCGVGTFRILWRNERKQPWFVSSCVREWFVYCTTRHAVHKPQPEILVATTPRVI
jgi:hypothetical protein